MDIETFFLSSLAGEFRKQLHNFDPQVVNDLVRIIGKKHIDKEEILSIIDTLVQTDDTEEILMEASDVPNGQ